MINDKYGTLVELCLENDGSVNGLRGEEKLGLKGRKLSLDDLLMKIFNLEQQLSTCKVELAVKSAELLVNTQLFRPPTSNIRRTPIASEDKP